MKGAAARGAAWAFAVGALAAALHLSADLSPVARMFVVVGGLFVGMKLVVAVEWRVTTGRQLTVGRWLIFGLAWPGMRPGDFLERQASPRPLDVWPGWRALLLGAALIAAARIVLPRSALGASLLAMPGFSLVLHFGLFRLLAAFWRARGFDVAAPFDAPLLSTSLGEFWSRRWNRAFSDMTALVVYRPMARLLGTGAGLAAAFVFSGALHELAISVPARGGYGGPFAYFLLHAALVGVERALQARGHFDWPEAARRLWTAAALILPLPILFHRAFQERVVHAILGG